jgi:hypothetical protein
MPIPKRLLPLALACLMAAPFAAGAGPDVLHRPVLASAVASPGAIDHSAWDQLLKAYVRPAGDHLSRVDYMAFKQSGQSQLKAYIRSLEATDAARLERPEQFAFWVNLYNAKTIDIVLDHYPVRSIRDINLGGSILSVVTGGPWKAKVLTVSGQALSLDDIEHIILRGQFRDPRVHFAVNCASVGCPSLSTEAFTGASLDAHLERNARAYVNSGRGVRLADGRVAVSSIFQWFKVDFGGSDGGVLDFVRTYAEPSLKASLAGVTRIDDTFYDWSLNDVAR